MRFFRSGLFPLIVIVLLVYLAGETILGDDSSDARRIAYGELVARVESDPGSIANVVFFPKSQRVEVTLRDESKLESNYPTETAQLDLQHRLEAEGVHFDSKGTGGSAGWSILAYLLPFVLFFGFWIFLMNQRHKERESARTYSEDQPGGTSRY